jgi:hypothetical protein
MTAVSDLAAEEFQSPVRGRPEGTIVTIDDIAVALVGIADVSQLLFAIAGRKLKLSFGEGNLIAVLDGVIGEDGPRPSTPG